MTIYLQSTPSIRKRKTTKASKKLLREENERRKKRGLQPLSSLQYQKLDKEKVRSYSNMPDYDWTPRRDRTKSIPSHSPSTKVDPNLAGRKTVMEKVTTGEITGKEAEEIIRKSKCLVPAFNKGAIQYIGDENAARDAGKKV